MTGQMVIYQYDKILEKLIWNNKKIEYISSSSSNLICIRTIFSGMNSSNTVYTVTESLYAHMESPAGAQRAVRPAEATQATKAAKPKENKHKLKKVKEKEKHYVQQKLHDEQKILKER